MTALVEAYHDATAAQHQARFENLSKEGFRIISLSVYGELGEARYAAVWVKREGPDWTAVHGVDSEKFQHAFDRITAKGFAPVIVSATGSGDRAVFAAVFERGIGDGWMARHGIPGGREDEPGTFQHANKSATAGQLILRSIAIYGTADDRRYAAVWHPNPDFVKWHAFPSETGESYAKVFAAETQLPGYKLHAYRPAYVAVSGDHAMAAVFKDDVVGDWSASHGLTGPEYERQLEEQRKKDFYPICLQGGGAGEHTRYAVIFAKDDVPARREWTATGDPVPELAGLDHLMQRFMRANGVRAAQLAVSKNGASRYSRAYAWAEPGYRVPRPSDLFLLASCSKMFLEAAVQALYDTGRLRPDTTVYPRLGFARPKDPRSDAITVQQLLDHKGGYNDSNTGSRFDPTYRMREIAEKLGLDRPVDKLDIARFMYARPLDFTPGEQTHYSNYGYLLLGALVERVTGMRYFDFMRQAVLEPAGITEVSVFPTRAADRKENMAIAEDEGLGLDPIDLRSTRRIPNVYGGDSEIFEVGDPQCGLCASARALVQMIHTHAVWGNGRRAPGQSRAGGTPGASTFARSRRDEVDWAVVVNTLNWAPSEPASGKHPSPAEHLWDEINRVLDSVHID